MMATELPELTDTEIPFHEYLVDSLRCFNERSIRRRVHIYLNGDFLPVPDKDYKITERVLIFPHPLKTLDVVTVSVPRIDERWYYSHADGWGQL